MKENIAYITYAIAAIVACYLAWEGLLYESIVARVYGLFSLAFIYFLYKGIKGWLFYLSLVFASCGEAFVILGFQKYELYTFLCFITYYWLTFFVIKKNIRETNFSIRLSKIIPGAIVLLLIIYLITVIIQLISNEIQNTGYLAYISITSFLCLIIYMYLIFVNNRSFRNFWLLPAIAAFCIAQAVIPLEAMYYNSIFLKIIGFLAEISSHFFVLKFLISTEESLIVDDNEDYL